VARSADDPARDRSLTVDELLEELEGASASHGGDAGLQEEIIEQLKQTGTLGDERITATLAEILDNIESSIDPDPAIAAAGGLRTLGGADCS